MACDTNLASAAQLGEFLGLSSSNIRNLAENGEIVRAPGRGRYLLRESIAKYCEKLRVSAGRSNTRGESTQALTNERGRLAKEQADVMALKAAALRGELVEASAVEREWADILRSVRAGVLAASSRISARVGLTVHDTGVIDEELRLALSALADGE